MDSRNQNTKLTRSERIKECNIPDTEIPERFIDHLLTNDIMEEPGQVDNEIMDLAFVKKWQQQEIEKAMQKNPPATPAEIRIISQTNPFTKVPYTQLTLLKELNQEIEEWVRLHEDTVDIMQKIRTANANKKTTLIQLTARKKFIEEMLPTLQAQLNKEKNETKIAEILAQVSNLTKEQDELPSELDKAKLGSLYYNNKKVINENLDKLYTKQKQKNLSAAEKEQIEQDITFWFDKLERSPHLLTKHLSPHSFFSGLSQITNSVQTNENAGNQNHLVAAPKLRGKPDE